MGGGLMWGMCEMEGDGETGSNSKIRPSHHVCKTFLVNPTLRV